MNEKKCLRGVCLAVIPYPSFPPPSPPYHLFLWLRLKIEISTGGDWGPIQRNNTQGKENSCFFSFSFPLHFPSPTPTTITVFAPRTQTSFKSYVIIFFQGTNFFFREKGEGRGTNGEKGREKKFSGKYFEWLYYANFHFMTKSKV